MQTEKNQESLRKAIEQLPDYQPKPLLWEQISASLDEAATSTAADPPLPLEQLPQYPAPSEVWNKLSRSLEEDSRLRRRTAQRMRLSQGATWAVGIAASALVIVCAAIWIMREPAPKVSLAYSQEKVGSFGLDVDWNEEEGSFEKLETELATSNRPELNSLRQELEELSAAKAEVVGMLASYGQDPQLINQLGDIERERSTIYRQIIEQI